MSTGIQWTDETWNPLRARNRATQALGWACVRVSPGCVNCYAAEQNEARRWNRGTGLDYTVPALEQVEHLLDERTLREPLHWQKPRRVFVCSMTDIFGEWVPDEHLDRIFAVMALTPQHTYQVLTKRPERMRAYLEGLSLDRFVKWMYAAEEVSPGATVPKGMMIAGGALTNVWLGVSAEDQERADERIPVLLDTPAAVRFVSAEPLLGAIEFSDVSGRADAAKQMGRRALDGIDWIIVGGESGPHARPFNLAWGRSIVEQCRAAAVPAFVKQLGSNPIVISPETGDDYELRFKHSHGGNPDEWPADLNVRQWPSVREGARASAGEPAARAGGQGGHDG